MTLRIVVTGGTFDKRYDELRGELTFGESSLPEILRQARLTIPVVVEVNQLIDSLFMTEADRLRVAESCAASGEDRLVIVHGTDTMTQTASLLGKMRLPKTIVLTGAMVPYAVSGSDAVFNLGFAVASAQHLSEGVYVAMNGRCFAWDNVRKESSLGVFLESQ